MIHLRVVVNCERSEGMLTSLMQKIADWGGGAMVGMVLSATFSIMVRFRRRRGKRAVIAAISGLDPANPPVALVGVPLRARPGSTELTQQSDALPLFGYGPFVSYATVATQLMRSLAPSAEIVLPEIVLGSQYDHLSEDKKRERDLLLLGYPAGNDAARILEPLMDLPVHFAAGNDRGLIANDTGAKLVEPIYTILESGACRTTLDFGLVAKVQHPFNPTKAILYLAGCETFGVKIAAESLKPDFMPLIFKFGKLKSVVWKHGWLPKLGMSRIRKAEFLAIFEANVQNLTTGTPKLRHSWTRTRDDHSWQRTYSSK
jgi:hypothetical protein